MLKKIITYSPYPIIYTISLLSTQILYYQTRWTMVLCVSIIGFLGSLLSQFLFNSIKKHAEALIFSGALASMAGPLFSHTLGFVFLTSLAASFLYFLSARFYPFLGGRLGTIAFFSTGISTLIMRLIYASF